MKILVLDGAFLDESVLVKMRMRDDDAKEVGIVLLQAFDLGQFHLLGNSQRHSYLSISVIFRSGRCVRQRPASAPNYSPTERISD